MNRQTLINYIAFGVLMVSTALGFQSVWGLIFLYWTIPNFYLDHAFLISDVTKAETPLLFWLVQIAWVVLGLLLIATDFVAG